MDRQPARPRRRAARPRARSAEGRLVARADRRAGPLCRGRHGRGGDHLSLHLRPDHPPQRLYLAALSAPRQIPPRLAPRPGGKSGPAYQSQDAACRASRRDRPAPRSRSLGSRPDGLRPLRTAHPHAARAHEPRPRGRTHRLQARRAGRRGHCRCPVRLASSPAPDRDLRQWNRVRPSLRSRRARDPDLLLRPPCPLAERRHRKCHRPHAPLPAAKDRSRRTRRTSLRHHPRRLQQHPAQMP